MKQEGLSFFTDTYLTVIGLLLFFLFFVGVILWVRRKSGATYYQNMEQMPLRDGEISYER